MLSEYSLKRREHWNRVAILQDSWQSHGIFYHKRIKNIYKQLIQPNQRILEIGCGRGELLSSLKPDYAVGIDFSEEMISRAQKLHPSYHFFLADAHSFALGKEEFHYVILSDICNDIEDVLRVFTQVSKVCTPRTRIILNFYSHLWELPLTWTQRLGLSTPALLQNWLTVEDISNLLYLAGLETIRSWQEVLLPLPIPGLADLCNKVLVKMWPFNLFAMTNFLIARPVPTASNLKPKVSVVIPARNEKGNIADILKRVPEMGSGTELIFVEGHSNDGTYNEIAECIIANPQRDCKLLRQTGKGKGDAVRLGFTKATGDILMILDADMTVQPEDLPRFLDVLVAGKADLVNGVRLVYPMDKRAMRFFNLLGNRFFSVTFSALIGQPIKDTLCGTKVLARADYKLIEVNRSYFGEFDPFGDFDLIFGAARLNMKIVDLPIRYRERAYGTTNIQRWKHGWMLFKMLAMAAKKIKFI